MLDVHSHILPGLDDGTKTADESLEAIRGLRELGFTTLVATPHFYPGRYTPSVDAIDKALEAMKERIDKENLDVTLLRGRECFLDYELLTAPERDTFPFTWNQTRFQLIELPSITVPKVISPYVDYLKQSRIFPILAHAERYNAVIRNPETARAYRNMGFRIQVDLANLSSSAHRAVRGAAQELFKLELVDLVASDVHRPSQLPSVREGLDFVRRQFGEEALARYVSLP